MAEGVLSCGTSRVGATPMHVRILEQSLGLNVFLNYAETELEDLKNEPEHLNLSQLEENEPETTLRENPPLPKVKKTDLSLYYNLENIDDDRLWLKDVLLTMDPLEETTDPDLYSDPNVVTEKDLQTMLKQHVHTRKHRKKFKKNPSKYQQYKYYGASLLSKVDMYSENKKKCSTLPKKEKVEPKRKLKTKNTSPKNKESAVPLHSYQSPYKGNPVMRDEDLDSHKPRTHLSHNRANKSKSSALNTPEQFATRRRKLWVVMAKKEMGKIQRSKANNHKEQLQTCKRTAQLCMKLCRQKAMQSQKNMKETIWRCKRLTREMQSYWKRYDRVEREMRRRMEKEAEEQRKMDVELIEAKRQQRKLNFLITQTELYAHFMSRKLGKASPEEQLLILSQLEEKKITRLAPLDDYDSDIMKMKAKRNVIEAIENDRARTKQFDKQLPKSAIAASSFLPSEVELEELDLKDANVSADEEHPQPNLFKGHLKGYQLKGMNWLANLYDQGISGILADEMGLGKTVQSIAFLCHVAEKYSVWGPFLVISPASTLHNWQQEMARFVPDFHVVPYWGNPNERKILRQFWEQKDLHTKEASFHVVITSYQIIITDFKYFNRIKWQYMILDEAQAIKSSSSVRWKMLLGFSCRNRLLLSGTPIQNSMAELWALLHFIMPTLFDSHDEFNEWFSKDIENHVENKTGIDEKHLSRLHMILKPFMLRRIKKDVENELSDKIEIMVYCPLTRRQKLLYMALKKKIRIEDLLHYTVGGGDSSNVDKNFTSNLMNLVMQFRKVCNHPELFERRDTKSPLFITPLTYTVPKLIYTDLNGLRNKQRLLFNQFYIWAVEYLARYDYEHPYNGFSFRFFTKLSPSTLFKIFTHGISEMWTEALSVRQQQVQKYHSHIWWDNLLSRDNHNLFYLTQNLSLSNASLMSTNILHKFIFTSPLDTRERVFKFGGQNIYGTECKKVTIKDELTESVDSPQNASPSDEYQNELKTWCTTQHNQPHFLPIFLNCYAPKTESKTIKLYCSCSSNAIYEKRIHSQENLVPMSDSTHQYGVTSQILHSVRDGHGLRGWFNVIIPDKETLVTDAGKLAVLDPLLKRLKKEGHRVLIYSQMTKMIDLLEEYMWHRKHKYMRLDGSSKISERRDMVADFQARSDIFVFLLSTRAGGLGINLTAADTVIFYDSDWNPTVDQQAMDRAHRLGQTKQVTVYRLICKGTIEERILQRAREKSEIQRMVISGGNFKPDTLKPKEVVSLLLDDEEIESKYRQRAEERKHFEELRERKDKDRKRKNMSYGFEEANSLSKRPKDELYNPDCRNELMYSPVEDNVITNSNCMISGVNASLNGNDESSSDALLDVETTIPSNSTLPISQIPFSMPYTQTKRNPRGTRRGRPRGSRRGGGTGSKGRDTLPMTQSSSSLSSGSSTIPVYLRDDHRESMKAYSKGSSSSNNVDVVEDTGQVKMTPPIRRGPGRPRLKPVGPGNRGGRGLSRPRKAARSLPVPLRAQQPALISTSLNDSLHNNLQFQPSYFNFYGSVTPPSPTV